MSANDVLVATTTISFDVAAADMFLPLIAGARMVIAQKSETVARGEPLDHLAALDRIQLDW
jgi:non-ribosomal peptide synthetase component F